MLRTVDSETNAGNEAPVFGCILFGGALTGALVRDVRVANELADRGYRVHVWWVMDQPRVSPLRPSIREDLLFAGMRYRFGRRSAVAEQAQRLLRSVCPDRIRARLAQRYPSVIEGMMRNFLRLACDGLENDMPVVQRFARQASAAGVTHVLPMIEVLAGYILAARRLVDRPIRYLITFQGYEMYANFARRGGFEPQLYDLLRDLVAQSDWPAVAVSADYLQRVTEDLGVERSRLVAIPPGVPLGSTMGRDKAIDMVAQAFKDYAAHLPLVTFLGHQDVEKGIDLLLYAANILRQRGRRFQLAICGPTLFGDTYSRVIRQISADLRLPVIWSEYVTDELRSALFTASCCVVYPSIHREPFGMVSVEAAACGTPVVVPDRGGVAETCRAPGLQCGLNFKTWDSGDLADKIDTLLTDEVLWRELSADGPKVADHYSVAKLADRLLEHMGVANSDLCVPSRAALSRPLPLGISSSGRAATVGARPASDPLTHHSAFCRED